MFFYKTAIFKYKRGLFVNMKGIDLKDKKILAALDMNARMPMKELAKKVRVSREVVEYRLKRLTKLGIVGGTHAVFDVDVIGYRSYRLLLRLFNLTQKEKGKLINYFREHKKTWWVASVGGRWDIIMNFIAHDQTEFNDIFEGIVAEYGENIQDYEILTYISINDFPRRYILNSKVSDEEFFHAMRYKPNVSVDKVDLKIMETIAANSRESYTDIAKEVGLTRNAVKSRIKKLEEVGLILGYRLTYHPSKAGKNSYLLMLNINNLKKDREKELVEYAKVNPNVIFAVKHIGKYRITFEVEIEDEKKFHSFLFDLRGKFNDILLDFDFFPIFYDHKVNYFPLVNWSGAGNAFK